MSKRRNPTKITLYPALKEELARHWSGVKAKVIRIDLPKSPVLRNGDEIEIMWDAPIKIISD